MDLRSLGIAGEGLELQLNGADMCWIFKIEPKLTFDP